MKRTEILVDPTLAAAIERRAKEEQTSMAAVVRRCIREQINLAPPKSTPRRAPD